MTFWAATVEVVAATEARGTTARTTTARPAMIAAEAVVVEEETEAVIADTEEVGIGRRITRMTTAKGVS
jgi:hypothetical protein